MNSLRYYSLLFSSWTLTLLCFLQASGVEGKPRGQRVEVLLASTGSDLGYDSQHSHNGSAPVIRLSKTEEQNPRLCLNRLRDALKSACSGSGRMPLYFDPHEIFNKSRSRTGGDSAFRHPDAKHLRNDISVMGNYHPQRRLLKRRSRRNIVRECCHRSCTTNDLMKYCSSGFRFSSERFRESPSATKDSQSSSSLAKLFGEDGKFKETKSGPISKDDFLSDSIPIQPNKTQLTIPSFQIQNSNDFKLHSPPSLQSCVTLADLQNFYNFLLENGFGKGLSESWPETSTYFPQSNLNSDMTMHPENTNSNLLPSLNSYAVETNQMQPSIKDFLNQIVEMKHRHFHSSASGRHPKPTETASQAPTPKVDDGDEDPGSPYSEERTEDSLDSDFSSASSESTSPSHHHRFSSNIETAKPITNIFINIPKGTNDYIY